jgi:hypothetical protein
MTKSQIFKSKFPEFVGVVNFLTSDCEQVNFIDVPNDLIKFTTTLMSWENSLSHVMDFMSDDEFENLLKSFK